MKKMTFILALAALLFASCKFTGPEGKLSGEKTSFEVSAYDIMAGLLFEEIDDTAGAGAVEAIIDNIYTISLEITGTLPEGVKVPDPITGTKLSDFAGKSFIINDLPVGEKFQFTLRVKDLGGELYEGTSDAVTITADMQTVPVSMNRVYDYLPLYSFDSDAYCMKIILKNLKNKYDTVKLSNPVIYNNMAAVYTTDDEGNLYTFEGSEGDNYYVVRYSPKTSFMKGEKIAVTEHLSDSKLVYDKSKGSLYIISPYEGMYLGEIENVKTVKATNEYSDFKHNIINLIFNGAATVYSGSLYMISRDYGTGEVSLQKYALSELMKEDLGEGYTPEKNVQLLAPVENTTSIENGEIRYNKLLNSVDVLAGSEFSFTDIVVNKNGIYLLCQEYQFDNSGYNPLFVRGGVVVLDSDLNVTKAKFIGFTNTKKVFDKGEDGQFYTYGPKSIAAGFYGPERILAIKEKELVFADNGTWPLDNGNQEKKKHIVTLNMDTWSWTAEETEAEFSYKNLSFTENCQFDAGEWVD